MPHMKLNLGKENSLKISRCDLFLFSHGGQLFAVIDSNIIQIISPVYLRVMHRLNHGQTV
jgi:hypothetical protein